MGELYEVVSMGVRRAWACIEWFMDWRIMIGASGLAHRDWRIMIGASGLACMMLRLHSVVSWPT